MRKENVAVRPSITERKYLNSKTFCLGFPQYKRDAFERTVRVIDAVRVGEIPYRGRGIGSRNQIVKDLIVYGLALKGNQQAINRMEQKGFEPVKEEEHGNTRTVA